MRPAASSSPFRIFMTNASPRCHDKCVGSWCDWVSGWAWWNRWRSVVQKTHTGWWFATTRLKKIRVKVNWDDHIPNINGTNMENHIHVPGKPPTSTSMYIIHLNTSRILGSKIRISAKHRAMDQQLDHGSRWHNSSHPAAQSILRHSNGRVRITPFTSVSISEIWGMYLPENQRTSS